MRITVEDAEDFIIEG